MKHAGEQQTIQTFSRLATRTIRIRGLIIQEWILIPVIIIHIFQRNIEASSRNPSIISTNWPNGSKVENIAICFNVDEPL